MRVIWGFSIEAISALIELQTHPDRSCQEANEIARAQLSAVQAKIRKLRGVGTRVETDLAGLRGGWSDSGVLCVGLPSQITSGATRITDATA